jgi:hypothetical protein
MRLLGASVAIGLVLGAAGAARAEETYRWLDAEGRVHFGSEPPPDARAVTPWSPGGERVKIAPKTEPDPALQRPPGAPPARAAEPAAAQPEERIGGRTETEWRAQARTLESRLRSLELELEQLEESTTAYGGWSTQRDGRRLERVLVPDERRALERALELAQSQLDALEDEARRLGVPPGWLR